MARPTLREALIIDLAAALRLQPEIGSTVGIERAEQPFCSITARSAAYTHRSSLFVVNGTGNYDHVSGKCISLSNPCAVQFLLLTIGKEPEYFWDAHAISALERSLDYGTEERLSSSMLRLDAGGIPERSVTSKGEQCRKSCQNRVCIEDLIVAIVNDSQAC